MVYKIFLTNQARKFLEDVDIQLKKRLKLKISLLSDPFEIDSIKIKGEENTYRTRLGDYRILFLIQKEKNIVVVVRIDKRSRVYKRWIKFDQIGIPSKIVYYLVAQVKT